MDGQLTRVSTTKVVQGGTGRLLGTKPVKRNTNDIQPIYAEAIRIACIESSGICGTSTMLT